MCRRMQACPVALPRSRAAKATLRHGHMSRRAGARHAVELWLRPQSSGRPASVRLSREAEGTERQRERQRGVSVGWRGEVGMEAVAEARDADLTAFCRIEGAISKVEKRGKVRGGGGGWGSRSQGGRLNLSPVYRPRKHLRTKK